jgi:hypothetical protein
LRARLGARQPELECYGEFVSDDEATKPGWEGVLALTLVIGVFGYRESHLHQVRRGLVGHDTDG